MGSPKQLREHPLRGAIFETWVVSEILKARAHRGLAPELFHSRDRTGTEVDAVLERGVDLVAVETKSGQTIAGDFFAALAAFAKLFGSGRRGRAVRQVVIYGGKERQLRTGAAVLPWCAVDACDWAG